MGAILLALSWPGMVAARGAISAMDASRTCRSGGEGPDARGELRCQTPEKLEAEPCAEPAPTELSAGKWPRWLTLVSEPVVELGDAAPAGARAIARAAPAPRDRVERVVFSEMAFIPDSDQLSDVGVGRCYLVAQKLRQGTDVRVVVQRRPADPGGSAAQGQKLDRLRADAVRLQLENFGVAAARMSTVGPARSRPGLAAKAGWTCPVSQGLEFEIDAAKEHGTESMNLRGGGSGL